MSIAADNKENLILSVGKSFLHFNKVDNLDYIKSVIEGITAQELHETALELFDKRQLTYLIYD